MILNTLYKLYALKTPIAIFLTPNISIWTSMKHLKLKTAKPELLTSPLYSKRLTQQAWTAQILHIPKIFRTGSLLIR